MTMGLLVEGSTSLGTGDLEMELLDDVTVEPIHDKLNGGLSFRLP